MLSTKQQSCTPSGLRLWSFWMTGHLAGDALAGYSTIPELANTDTVIGIWAADNHTLLTLGECLRTPEEIRNLVKNVWVWACSPSSIDAARALVSSPISFCVLFWGTWVSCTSTGLLYALADAHPAYQILLQPSILAIGDPANCALWYSWAWDQRSWTFTAKAMASAPHLFDLPNRKLY